MYSNRTVSVLIKSSDQSNCICGTYVVEVVKYAHDVTVAKL